MIRPGILTLKVLGFGILLSPNMAMVGADVSVGLPKEDS